MYSNTHFYSTREKYLIFHVIKMASGRLGKGEVKWRILEMIIETVRHIHIQTLGTEVMM